MCENQYHCNSLQLQKFIMIIKHFICSLSETGIMLDYSLSLLNANIFFYTTFICYFLT